MRGYLKEIVDDLWSGDVLCLCGKGLGKRVVSSLLLRCLKEDGGGVILCLNVDGDREDGIASSLHAQNSPKMPVFASAETHSRDRRRKLYEEASRSTESPLVLCLASCRVAIVDMLDGTLDPRNVKGVVVNDAHRASEGSAEGFVIRAFRRSNWTGWVRAFSDEAALFVKGFAKVTKVMKELEVERLALWPRFEARVSSCLDRIPVHVVELRRTPSAALRRTQNAAIVALQSCLDELKKASAGLVFLGEDVDKSKNPFAACDAAVRAVQSQYGGGAVASVPPKARVLAVELKSLRDLVEAIPRYDAVALYDLALSIRDSALKGGGRRPVSSWASHGYCLDELIVAARACVFEVSRDKTKLTRILEENAKWHLVAEALRTQESGERVVVLARDDYAADGVAEYLSLGGIAAMEARFLRFLERHNTRAKSLPEARRSADQKLLLAEEEALISRKDRKSCHSRRREGADGILIIATHAQWRARDDALGEWVPDTVVLIDAEPEFVREVEAYQSNRPRGRKPVTLYVLACEDTADDAVYSVQLAAETEAFEKLVEERRLALVPSSESRVAQRRAMAEEEDETARRKKTTKRASIIVDSREFRSQLPSALHAKNVDLEPATLVVGDYVLAPDLVVERKSLTDLAGSLQSGRLYTQVEAMQRHYSIPVLLVETSASFFGASSSKPPPANPSESAYNGKATSWNDAQPPSEAVAAAFDDVDELPSVTSLEARFAIIALTYPRLRVVWCHDVNATVNIFAGLKRGREQPSLQAALEKSSHAGEQDDGGGRNVAAIDLLLKLPGVNDKNVTQIIEQVESIKELATLDRQTLTPIVGPSNAKLLFDFFHEVDNSFIPLPDHSPLAHTVAPGASKKNKHRDPRSSSPYLSSSASATDAETQPKKRRAGPRRP